MIQRRIVGAFALALSLLGLGACSSSGSGDSKGTDSLPDSTQLVDVSVVEMQSITSQQEYTALLEPKVTNSITAQAGGRVKQILVSVGARVSAGQVVARMEATQSMSAQIQLADAKLNLARMDELYRAGGVSKAQWEQAKSAADQAQLTYNNAAENTALRSPISGYVTAKNYDNGDMTSPTQPILVIQQIAPVKAVIGVSEQYYSQLRLGLEASLQVDALGDATIQGRITKIYPTIDPTTHTVGAEVEVPNTDHRLRPGMYARVHLNFGPRQALTVADQAVVRQAGSGIRYVYVVQKGRAVYRAVELGEQQGDRYEVLSGLSAGEQVIITAPSRLKDGTPVKLRN